MRRSILVAALFVLTVGRSDAYAWGCEGHRAVAMLAERMLPPATIAAAKAVLAASPVDPALKRGCPAVPGDPLADESTWADDYRNDHPETFGWHFSNIPRVFPSNTANPATACLNGNCAIDAIVAQFHTLTHSSNALAKANALRFILHFVGDLHQPLHSTSNGDRGGNCVPVTFHGVAPQENQTTHDFSPNLHSIWDSGLIRRYMSDHALVDARALAADVTAHHALPASVAAEAPTKVRVTSWAREAHGVGRTIAYGKLPIAVAMEPATALTLSSCQDNNDIVHRMLALHEQIGDAYQSASEPAILSQLRLAGIHLAEVLKATF